MIPTPPKFEIPVDQIRWADDNPANRRGLLTVEILGTRHHMMFIPVELDEHPDSITKDEQVGATAFADQDLDALHDLYEDSAAFATVKIPGRTGAYVCYLHPSEE